MSALIVGPGRLQLRKRAGVSPPTRPHPAEANSWNGPRAGPMIYESGQKTKTRGQPSIYILFTQWK